MPVERVTKWLDRKFPAEGSPVASGSVEDPRRWTSTSYQRWVGRHRGSAIGMMGVVLVNLGVSASLVFGMLMSFDPAEAGPGVEDPRQFASIALGVSVVILIIGFVLAGLGRWRINNTLTAPPKPPRSS
jgi:coproporphyrinogen III oxidase